MKKTKLKIAIIGAEFIYGVELLSALAENNFPFDNITALTSKSRKGKQVSYGEEKILTLGAVDDFDFKNIDIAIFISQIWDFSLHVKRSLNAGKITFDIGSRFSLDETSNIIIHNINDIDIDKKKLLYAIPTSCTHHIVSSLANVHENYGLKNLVISTYHSVSELDREAMDDLYSQTKSIYMNQHTDSQSFPKRIAFNVIPQIGHILQSNQLELENTIQHEINSILDKDIRISISCAMVPVYVGNQYSVFFETEENVDLKAINNAIEKDSGIILMKNGEIVTSAETCRETSIYISRLRQNFENQFSMFVTADNMKCGIIGNIIGLLKTFL